ncbi:MAG: hypothetical protein DRP78_06065 [Candidatus Omnitrophota bacterium]|nr:MAG: hypothetical protein DRP78_06065 [Candidatus Omnitrophota bacterium]
MIIPKCNRFSISGRSITPHLETFIIGQTSTQRAAPAVWLRPERSNLAHRETLEFHKAITFWYKQLSFFLSRALSVKTIFFFYFCVVFSFSHCCLANADNEHNSRLDKAAFLFNQGKLKNAIAEYRKLEQLMTVPKEPILNLALIYKNLRQYKKSILEYKKLLAIAPDKIVYANLGEVYYLNAMPDLAIDAFNTALKMGDKGEMLYFWLAKCYEDKGDWQNAVLHYKRALGINDEMVLSLQGLGNLYVQKKMWAQAETELKKIKKLDPSMLFVYPALALAYFSQAKYDLSLKAFRHIRAYDPQNKEAVKYIDKIYQLAGKDFKSKLLKKEKSRIADSHAKKLSSKVISGAPLVRVCIGRAKKLRFKCASDFHIYPVGKSSKVLFSGNADTLCKVCLNNGKLMLSLQQRIIKQLPLKIIIAPQSSILIFGIELGNGQYWANKIDRIYRGKIEIMPDKNGEFKIINIVNLEEYLYSVLPSEMPSSWPMDALKAQAVAARSEAYVKFGRHKKEGFDFCSGVHCQSYGGANVESKDSCSAVDTTQGEIAVYQGMPIDAVYSNSCGGHTQGNIFAKCDNIPYLQGKQDTVAKTGYSFPLAPFALEDWLWGNNLSINCDNREFSRQSNFRWTRLYKRKELEKLINKKLSVRGLIAINILERDKSSHIKSIEIVDINGRFIVKKELVIRRMLGNLRSSMFNIDVKLDKNGHAEEFLFYGGGWGHGVGMCQVGAATMAQKGYSYSDILKFYYTDIDLKKMY